MLRQLTHTQVWVHDREEALALYTEKLGMEVREDVTLPEVGSFRWLTVGVPRAAEHGDRPHGRQARPHSTKTPGRRSWRWWPEAPRPASSFSTDDCLGSYEELKRRGIEFLQAPTEQPTFGPKATGAAAAPS